LITSSEAVAVDTSSVAITHDGLYSHIDIDWNTDGEAIDVSGSLTNQSTSPTYISGLSSNISIISLRPITRFRRRWLLLALKTGRFKHNCDYRHPVSISSSSYFSFTTSNYTSAVVSTATGDYAYANGTYAISYSSQLNNATWAAVNALYNSSLNWLSNSGNYIKRDVYRHNINASKHDYTGEYIGINLPYGLVLKEYNLARITSNATYNLSSYALVGSVDRINWKTLDKQDLPPDVSYTIY
jgi:hypothetical protein